MQRSWRTSHRLNGSDHDLSNSIFLLCAFTSFGCCFESFRKVQFYSSFFANAFSRSNWAIEMYTETVHDDNWPPSCWVFKSKLTRALCRRKKTRLPYSHDFARVGPNLMESEVHSPTYAISVNALSRTKENSTIKLCECQFQKWYAMRQLKIKSKLNIWRSEKRSKAPNANAPPTTRSEKKNVAIIIESTVMKAVAITIRIMCLLCSCLTTMPTPTALTCVE